MFVFARFLAGFHLSPFTFKQRGEQEEMMHFPVVQSIFNKSKYPVQLEKHI